MTQLSGHSNNKPVFTIGILDYSIIQILIEYELLIHTSLHPNRQKNTRHHPGHKRPRAFTVPGQNFDFSEGSLAVSLMFEGRDLLDGNLRLSFVVQSRPENWTKMSNKIQSCNVK